MWGLSTFAVTKRWQTEVLQNTYIHSSYSITSNLYVRRKYVENMSWQWDSTTYLYIRISRTQIPDASHNCKDDTSPPVAHFFSCSTLITQGNTHQVLHHCNQAASNDSTVMYTTLSLLRAANHLNNNCSEVYNFGWDKCLV